MLSFEYVVENLSIRQQIQAASRRDTRTKMMRRAVIILSCVFLAAGIDLNFKKVRGVQIKNTGNERLWIEMTDEDSFVLPAGQIASVLLDYGWTGTISGRSEDCQSKKCDTPTTSARLQFGGEKGEDHYHVYMVDGFNVPVKIVATGQNNFCKTAVCNVNINEQCPTSHQIKNEAGRVLACKPLPDLFHRMCPQAVSTAEDLLVNNVLCKTSNTYFISIG